MKKIALLFLCLTVLLSGCAVSAITPGQAGVRYGLGGLKAAFSGETADGQSDITVEALANDAPVAAVEFTLLDGGIDEASWLDVDLSEAVDLTGMTKEELESELVMLLGSLSGQAAAGLAIAAMNGHGGLFD